MYIFDVLDVGILTFVYSVVTLFKRLLVLGQATKFLHQFPDLNIRYGVSVCDFFQT